MRTAANTDIDQVVAVATDYLTSFYEGSAEERAARIERAIHPHLAKRCPSNLLDDGAFKEWTVPEMIEIAAGSVDEPATTPYSVRVLDVSPTMASVRTDAEWGIDYIHLGKIDGQWKVVNVLWDDQMDAVSSD
jgi:Putative lumazine-binding